MSDGSPYQEPKKKCPESGCGKWLWKDGYCHNHKCRREQRLMSLAKTQGNRKQQVDGMQAFRRFLAD